MNFQVSKNSPIPLATQLKERITIALSLGELRPGDTLPSIRDLEQSLGIGRSIVRRAYLELSEQGLLEMKHGRRVFVRDAIAPAVDSKQLAVKLDAIVKQALDRARKLNVNEISFARYLLSRTLETTNSDNLVIIAEANKPLATERAHEISEAWGIHVCPVAVDDLAEFISTRGRSIDFILTSYYRLEHVLFAVEAAANGTRIKVVPLSIRFKPDILERIESLPPHAKVCLFSEPRVSGRSAASYEDVYRQAFPNTDVQFYGKEVSTEGEILKAISSGRFELGMINTLLWDKLSEETRKHPKLLRSRSEIDRDSLEAARVRAGIFAIPQ